MAIWGDLRLGSAAVLAAVVVAGCGSGTRVSASSTASTSTAHAARRAPAQVVWSVRNICVPRARNAVAVVLGVKPSAVAERASMANSGFPQCAYRARVRGGRRVSVTSEVDTEPSAYQVLERTIVEASQIFPYRLSAAPVQVKNLGIMASWFPEEQHVMTTDAYRVITATVDWPAVGQRQRIALAVAASRPYLGRFGPTHSILNPNAG